MDASIDFSNQSVGAVGDLVGEVPTAESTQPQEFQGTVGEIGAVGEFSKKTTTAVEAIAPQPTTEEPLKVGDRVFWDDCYVHLTSLNPFKITAIQGDMAELDLVDHLVPLADLRRAS